MWITAGSEGIFCPHCGDRLQVSSIAVATRCASCRLVVGPGRGLTAEQAGALSAGSSAGTRLNAAKRTGAPPADPAEVVRSLRAVAARTGHPLPRLRMVDYDAQRASDPDLVPLDRVLATFGSWKAARAAAAHQDDPADSIL